MVDRRNIKIKKTRASFLLGFCLAALLAILMQMNLWYKANLCSLELLMAQSEKPPSTQPTISDQTGNESSPSLPILTSGEQEIATTAVTLPPFRILLGIFSMGDDKGRERRDLIRNTYLSFSTFLEENNITSIPLRYSRICSLHDYWHKTIPQPEQCQVLYTFVLGAVGKHDNSAPVEYLISIPGRPMTVDYSDVPNGEADTTYLNIRENMDFGKTNTWFHYASTHLPEELQIDMIGKVDTDTMVHPNKLVEEIEDRLKDKKNDTLVYGGSVIDNDKGHHYMQGGFYFLSRTVAQRITTGREDRWEIVMNYMPSYRFKRPEDVETGLFIKAFGGDNVFHMDMRGNFAFAHNKNLKKADIFQEQWDIYMGNAVAQDRLARIQTKYNTACPSQDVIAQEQQDTLRVPSSVTAKKRLDSLVHDMLEKCRRNQTETVVVHQQPPIAVA